MTPAPLLCLTLAACGLIVGATWRLAALYYRWQYDQWLLDYLEFSNEERAAFWAKRYG